jgi:outer membrane protein W
MAQIRSLVSVAALTLVAAGAGAQPMIQRGTQQLSVHVSPDFEGAIGDTLVARAGYGLFLRNRLAVRGTLDYAVLEDVAGNDADYRTTGLGLALEYHLDRWGALVPYVGAGVGWRSSHFGKFEESGPVYGPRIGLAYFLADNVALDLEVTYEIASKDVFINDFVPEDSDLTTVLGIRVHF